MPNSTVQLDQTWNTGSQVPGKVQLLPASTEIKGRDGRLFKNTVPQKIVEHFEQDKKDIVIDIEHASLLQADKGQPAPAAGWITALEWQAEEGLFGAVRWTALGGFAVGASEYRYLSPVLIVDEEQQVIGIDSVALTNRPNLKLSSLNNQRKPESMNATEPKITANSEVKEISELAKVLEVQAASAERASGSELEFAKQIVDQGIQQGKIMPAVRSHYLRMCQRTGDALRLAEMVAQLPTMYLQQSLNFNQNFVEQPRLSSVEQTVAKSLGIQEEEFYQTKTNL